jgi:CRISPR/Cas system CSM-associated protein Csm3 (group 7 of RAMP superfamily)
MHSRHLQINVLDLWLVNSGRGEGAHIDSTPLLDTLGLPYIPGRAIKGLLRDAVLDYTALQPHGAKDANDVVTTLFGTREADQTRFGTLPGRLRCSDARLGPSLTRALAENQSARAGLFHDVQTTALDDDTGTVRPHSLRTTRTVVPLRLAATIETSDAKDFELLIPAVQLIVSFGSHRTRGFGRCACSIT